MLGLHITIFHNYGDYQTATISKRGKDRIWFKEGEMPTRTAINVVCAKTGIKFFLKYKIAKK